MSGRGQAEEEQGRAQRRARSRPPARHRGAVLVVAGDRPRELAAQAAVLALEHLDLPLELVHPPLLAVAGLGGGAAVARHAPCLASLLVEGERQPLLVDQEVVDADSLGVVGGGVERHE